ncbi:MAG TPA: PorP/SprF family type IX secretion system membrane protein [Bacteroidia bacterium]|nr:PorP/SprF family type IX secretion system membrane protein [Bacteroidia bacterium]
MKKLLIFFSLAFPFLAGAQDFHYSMYTMAPLTLNPSLAGSFTGDLRIVNNYRMQWMTVSKPFTTYTFGGDMPLARHDREKPSPDYFAIGANVNVDKAGSTNFKTNQFNGLFSYHKSLDGVGRTFFSFGIQAGVSQRSISLGGQSWDMQFNGLQYDAALPTGENASVGQSFTFFDFGAGASFSSVANDRFKTMGGLAVSHLNRPRVDFMGSDEKQYMKFTLHWSAQVALGQNSNAWLLPQLLFVQEGPARMINAGAGVKYRLSERSHYTNYQSEKSFSIGGMYRVGDAMCGYIRFDVGPVGFAFDYDFNTSQLAVASNGMGALEFMLIYTGIYNDKNTRLATPSFY